jgi:FkbH-like protein
MFEFDWAARALWAQEPARLPAQPSRFDGSIQGAMVLEWREHCTECAIPQCYSDCALYVRRRDQKCARLVYGIVRNRDFSGLLPYGADVRFRRWGKLEAHITGRYLPLSQIRWMNGLDRAVTSIVNALGKLLSPIDPKRRVNGALTKLRGGLLNQLGRRGVAYDGFAIECYSFHPEPCRLIVELRNSGITVFREGLELRFGYNAFSPAVSLPADFGSEDACDLMIYPDGDKELRLVFTWLDFFVLNKSAKGPAENLNRAALTASSAQPAAKVKCVAWDLDNTLWTGTLAEDGEANLRLREEAVAMVRWFDERGILQTAVSKNNHDDAMTVLRRFGLDNYFLYPAINWGPKSTNLMQIADRLNIHIDTFAFIDDSPFERSEVAAARPMVRVFADGELSQLRTRPEFDVPVTEASRMRRKSYLTEMERERAKEISGSDYLAFLRSCELRLRLLHPFAKDEIARCLELIQRSNQLNLSSRRYDLGQFDELLANPDMLCVAMNCADRFGDYGIVGFASVDLSGEDPVAKDFVLSCRVAQKHVEHAFYGWLGETMKREGARQLLIDLIKTARNRPLVKVFEEMPFTTVSAEGEHVLLALDLTREVEQDGVVILDDSAIALRRVP